MADATVISDVAYFPNLSLLFALMFLERLFFFFNNDFKHEVNHWGNSEFLSKSSDLYHFGKYALAETQEML